MVKQNMLAEVAGGGADYAFPTGGSGGKGGGGAGGAFIKTGSYTVGSDGEANTGGGGRWRWRYNEWWSWWLRYCHH